MDSDEGSDQRNSEHPEVDEFWGSPARVRDWLGVPLLVIVVGIAASAWLLVHASTHSLTVPGWMALGCAVAFGAAGVQLGISGYRAYSRFTVEDTRNWLRARIVCGSILGSAFCVAGVFGAANALVLAGVGVAIGTAAWAFRIPEVIDPGSQLARIGVRASATQALVVLFASLVAGIAAFTLPIPRSLSSSYIGGGVLYVSLAVAALIYLRRFASQQSSNGLETDLRKASWRGGRASSCPLVCAPSRCSRSVRTGEGSPQSSPR